MFGLLDWIKIGVSAAAGALVAGTAAYWIGHGAGVTEGRTLERTAALERSMDLIRERNNTNAKINDLDDAGLCAALGGRWVQPDNLCE